jgi:hypothetical protein
MTTKPIIEKIVKKKISSNIGSEAAARFFHSFWTYRVSQLTTSNVRSMKDATVATSLDKGRSGDKEDGEGAPVKSDLQPHAMHQFVGEEHPSLVVCVPKSSAHYTNLVECPKASLMAGHTDPQLFHWFKLLGTLPPRGIMTGKVEILSGDLMAEAWEKTFIRHPVLHNLAQEMWQKDQTKTEEEKERIATREREEDEKRMRRMSSSDWRSKFKDRERNPTEKEDEEKPVYVIKPDAFALVRMRPELKMWTSYSGQISRVYDPFVPPMDPLARSSHRFIKMLNVAREKLVTSLNMNYNLKLRNVFIVDLDCRGMWAMGTLEDEQLGAAAAEGGGGKPREAWVELRLHFGKEQVIKTEHEMEWWIRGLTRLGAPEMAQTNATSEDAQNSPEEYDFRHL